MVTEARIASRERRLRESIDRALQPLHLEIGDDSDVHAGHPGAAGGAGHYRVVIVSARFDGLDLVARHRLVYAAVGDLIPAEVHALTIAAYTSDEWRR